MKNEELISVVIPTYNQPVFLKEAIDSVLKQTYKNFELLIIDDCSTDNTSEVVLSFKDIRIRYIKTDRNIRPPGSWNYGAKISKGKFISILPHDDVWQSNFLEEMIKEFKKNPDISFVQCNFTGINERSEIIIAASDLKDILFSNGVEALEWQLKNLRCNPAALLFDFKKLKDAGFWREDYWDDWAIILKLAYRYGFSYTKETYSSVRNHENNLSKILNIEKRFGAMMVLDQLFDIFSFTQPHTVQTLSIFFSHLRRLSLSMFFTSIKHVFKGNFSESKNAFRISRIINPIIPFDFKIIEIICIKIIKIIKNN